MQENKHIGSNFDTFLEEEGILAEVETVAVGRIAAGLQKTTKTTASEAGNPDLHEKE